MSETYGEEKPHIIAIGDVCNGFDFIGPFATFDLAAEYCKGFVDPNWVIAELAEPTE